MSNKRDPGKILKWESGLTPIDEELIISYSNQNGVSDQPKVKYSLNDINGFLQKNDEIFNIIKMN